MGRGGLAVSLLALVLVGCGGGGGSNPAPPAAITPTPSPTPTPTPTPVVLNTGEVKPGPGAVFFSATLELDIAGGYSQTNGILTGGMTSVRVATLDTPQFTAIYNSGYQLYDAVNAATFGRAQLALDNTTPNGNGVVLFANNTAGAVDYLALYQVSTFSSSSKGSGYTTAKYGGAGGWQHTVGNGQSGHTRLDYFAYGTPTPLSAMPKSGVVKYTVLKTGNFAADTDLIFLTQGSSEILTVDFRAGTISGQFGLAGVNFFKNESGSIGGFKVDATINGNSATGRIVNGEARASSTVPGKFRIMFVGPDANELVITFMLADGTGAAVGAGVGVIDPFR